MYGKGLMGMPFYFFSANRPKTCLSARNGVCYDKIEIAD